MKMKMILGAIALLFTTTIMAQKNEEQAIEKTIRAFAKAGDENNANELEKHLDANYRIAMNQLFGSTEVSIMPRAVYLEKIRTKEFGGDERTVSIKSISVNGNTASAHVIMEGSKMTLNTIFTFIKDKNGVWKVLSDMPVIG